MAEEEARLKKEFKKAAIEDAESDSDNFLKKKDESSEDEEIPEDLTNLKPERVLNAA